MDALRRVTAILLGTALTLVFDGILLLACPAMLGAFEAPGCGSCPREKPSNRHCPIAPGTQLCPLLESDRLPGETAAKSIVAPPSISALARPLPLSSPMPAAAAGPVFDASGLYLLNRVLRL